ncbi:MAG: hypothetical protein LBR16_02965 [Treponema sp.]|jgi:hypothetical protein|nr:hypothetical protein [Treponema sp.]
MNARQKKQVLSDLGAITIDLGKLLFAGAVLSLLTGTAIPGYLGIAGAILAGSVVFLIAGLLINKNNEV